MNKFKQLLISMISSALLTAGTAQAAFDDSGTDYSNATADTWIEMGEVMEPLNMVDMLLCIMNATGAHLVINGTYTALVDQNQCQTHQESGDAPDMVNVTLVTSRSSDTAPQEVQVWFDAGPNEKYLVETQVTEAASATAPFGSFTFAWQSAIDANDKGTMQFVAGETSTEIKLAMNNTHNSGNTSSFDWMHASVTNDQNSGTAEVVIGDDSYLLNFDRVNGGHVNYQKDGEGEKCFDRDNLTRFVYDYNLYDADTGALKDLSGGFQCKYTSGDSEEHCHIGPWGGWFEGNESGADRPTEVTDKDDNLWTGITYDDEDANNDGLRIVVPGYTFDDPLVFQKAEQTANVKTAMGNHDFLDYFGDGQLHGLPWACSTDRVTYVEDDHAGSCNNAVDWRPLSELPDGTVLTQAGTSTQYVTKAAVAMKVMAEEPGACSGLPLAGIGASFTDLTSDDINAVTITWADKPVVTDPPRVIHGVLQ